MSLYEDDGKPPVIYYNVLNGFESEEPFAPELCGINMDLETYNKKVEETRQEEIKRWNDLREWGLKNGTTNLEFADENWIYQPPGVIRVDRYNAHLYYSPNASIHDNFTSGITQEIKEIVTKPEYAAGTVIFSSQDGTTSQVISTTPKTRSRMDSEELWITQLLKNKAYAEAYLNKELIEKERRNLNMGQQTTLSNPYMAGDGIINLGQRLMANQKNGIANPNAIPSDAVKGEKAIVNINGLTTNNNQDNIPRTILGTPIDPAEIAKLPSLTGIGQSLQKSNNTGTTGGTVFTSPSAKIKDQYNQTVQGASIALAGGDNSVKRLGDIDLSSLNLTTLSSNKNGNNTATMSRTTAEPAVGASNAQITDTNSNATISATDIIQQLANAAQNNQTTQNQTTVDQNTINALITALSGNIQQQKETPQVPLIQLANIDTQNSLHVNLMILSDKLVNMYKNLQSESDRHALNSILELAGINMDKLMNKGNMGVDYDTASKALTSVDQLIKLFKTCNDFTYVQKANLWDTYLKNYCKAVVTNGRKSYVEAAELYRFIVDFTYDGLYTVLVPDAPELKALCIEAIKYFEKHPIYKTAPSQAHPTGEINMSAKIYGTNGLIERELSKLNNQQPTTISSTQTIKGTNGTSYRIMNTGTITSNNQGGNSMNSMFAKWDNNQANNNLGTANGFGTMSRGVITNNAYTGQGISAALGGTINNNGTVMSRNGVGVGSNIGNSTLATTFNRTTGGTVSSNTNGLFGLQFNSNNQQNGGQVDILSALINILGSVQNINGQVVVPVNAITNAMGGGSVSGPMESYGVAQNNGFGFTNGTVYNPVTNLVNNQGAFGPGAYQNNYVRFSTGNTNGVGFGNNMNNQNTLARWNSASGSTITYTNNTGSTWGGTLAGTTTNNNGAFGGGFTNNNNQGGFGQTSTLTGMVNNQSNGMFGRGR